MALTHRKKGQDPENGNAEKEQQKNQQDEKKSELCERRGGLGWMGWGSSGPLLAQ